MDNLVKGIQVLQSLSQLNQPESNQFIIQLYHQSSRPIHSLLFKWCCQSENANFADEVIKLAGNILNARLSTTTTTTTEEDEVKQTSLDSIPSALITETASYLDQNSYFNFQTCNRLLYTSCNAPNKLKILNLLDTKNYRQIKLYKYQQLKSLYFNLKQFDQIQFKSKNAILTKLEEVYINGRAVSYPKHHTSFTKNKYIDTSKVTELMIENLQDDGWCKCFDAIVKMFDNIHILSIKYSLITNINGELLKSKWPNLYHLTARTRTDAVNKSLVESFGNQLQFLEIVKFNDSEWNLQTIHFGNLIELCLEGPTKKICDDILSTASKLEILNLTPIGKPKKDHIMSEDETCKTITNALISCTKLVVLELERIPCQWSGRVLNCLHEIISNNTFKRDELEIISGICPLTSEFKVKCIQNDIKKLINSCNNLNCDTWIFKLVFKAYHKLDDNNKEPDECMEEIKNAMQDIKIKRIRPDVHVLMYLISKNDEMSTNFVSV